MFCTATIRLSITWLNHLYVPKRNGVAAWYFLGQMISGRTVLEMHADFNESNENYLPALSHRACPFCQAINMTFVR